MRRADHDLAGVGAAAFGRRLDDKLRKATVERLLPYAANARTHSEQQVAQLAASMIEASAWMRDFGGMSDDPKMALSWESHYQTLLKSALEEEARKKGQGPGWQPFSPTPEAKPRM